MLDDTKIDHHLYPGLVDQEILLILDNVLGLRLTYVRSSPRPAGSLMSNCLMQSCGIVFSDDEYESVKIRAR